MMGQHTRSESLFYYFRLEDHIPENHLLRLIDRHISFDFVREKLRDSYSDWPSIDPEGIGRVRLRCIPHLTRASLHWLLLGRKNDTKRA